MVIKANLYGQVAATYISAICELKLRTQQQTAGQTMTLSKSNFFLKVQPAVGQGQMAGSK
jgi:uncharacterized protein with gpF-like domain